MGSFRPALVLLAMAAAFGAEPLRIATFKVDVTPPLGSPLCCSAGVKPAAKVVDPLSARGIILLGGPKPIVLAVVDWEGIANEGWDEWRRAIATAAKTEIEHVSVHTLHQHDAPGYDPSAERILKMHGLGAKLYDPAFMQGAIKRVTAAVREAARKPETVTHLGLGRAKVAQVASNRRVLGPDGKVKYVRFSSNRIPEAREAPEGVVDPYVRLVSFWNGDRPLVSMTYYATHPQSYYGQSGVSADFVGMARSMREDELPVAHIHFNGAGGNVAAGKYNDGSPEMRPILARRLADGMKAAWESMTKTPIQASDIGWRTLPVSLPTAEGIRDEGRLQAVIEDSKKLVRDRLTAGRDLAFARLRAADRTIPVSLLTLGPARVVHMPGELFVEYELAAQDRAPGSFVAMAAYGDYGPGYIGTRVSYTQGGYETGPVSRTSPDVEGVLTAAIRELIPASVSAQKDPLQEIVEAARADAPVLANLLGKGLPELKGRDGVLVWGQEFFFAVESATPASVSIDKQPPLAMKRVTGTNYWYLLKTLRMGTTHQYLYSDAAGKPIGTYEVASYNPDSYPLPSVARGTLSERKTLTSKIYPSMPANYWVYTNPGIDTVNGAPLMVWQDGETIVGNQDLVRLRLQIVSDNLVARGSIPPMVHVLIQPGQGGPRMRSVQYDTVSGTYGKYLLEEILPDVEKTYKLRKDAYSRALAGASSGAICAFNAAWHYPEQFSRVLSHIGSYTALQWRPEEHLEGGYVVSYKVGREPKKNLRVWMSDGADDIDSRAGSWPLNNIQLANMLKQREYDFHFRFGGSLHAIAQGAMDLPESLTWLWRDYDPAKTAQTYEMEEAERKKPPFRVTITNRDAW